MSASVKVAGLLPILLAACATSFPSNSVSVDPQGYVWVVTPRPQGEDVTRSAQFRERLSAALARRGYHEDARGTLAIAISFTGAHDPSLGQRQGGYAIFIPDTQCDSAPFQLDGSMSACVRIFEIRSGRPLGMSSPPVAWNADDSSMDRAVDAALAAG